MDKDDLERDIFGGSDSELSSEDEAPRQIQPSPPPVGDESSEDEYVQPTLPKFKRKGSGPSADVDGGAAGGGEVKKRKKVKRREVRREREKSIGEDAPVLGPEELRKLELNMTIDNIIKPNKNRPKKRKKNADEEILDVAGDEEVTRLKIAMNAAFIDDREANANQLPATAKLKMLPEVMEVLQRTSLWQSILDQNLLESVKDWLEPLPDKSLPALNIQNAFFEYLLKAYIDTNTLKDSSLGRIVLFYTKPNKRVSSQIRRQADILISQWSRPIIKSSASYRDRPLTSAQVDPASFNRRYEKLSVILARNRLEDVGRVRKNAVRIPERNLGDYTVIPKSTVGMGGQGSTVEVERRRMNAERLRKMKRKLDLNRQKVARNR